MCYFFLSVSSIRTFINMCSFLWPFVCRLLAAERVTKTLLFSLALVVMLLVMHFYQRHISNAPCCRNTLPDGKVQRERERREPEIYLKLFGSFRSRHALKREFILLHYQTSCGAICCSGSTTCIYTVQSYFRSLVLA